MRRAGSSATAELLVYSFSFSLVKCHCRCVALYVGLAIDVERQKLYYIDESANGGKVGELSTNGTDHRVLYTDASSRPGGIVIDVNNR